MRADVRVKYRPLMRWTAPATGIAMCQIAAQFLSGVSLLVANSRLPDHAAGTSALPPKADVRPRIFANHR